MDRELAFRRVLFLGAHPDDEMGCAGTIARLSGAGAEISAIAFSTCADLVPPPFTPADLVLEWHEALDLLGVGDRTMLDYPNRRLPEHRQAILNVMDSLRDSDDFDLVLVPASADVHQDHQVIYNEAIRVFKRTTVLGYELPFNHIRGSSMTAFVRLEPEFVDRKVQHAEIFKTQASKPYVQERHVRALAAVRGLQAGVESAEAFEVIRWIM